MKNVLITGGAGFIAHHIIAHIIKHTDWKITTIDRLDISGNLNRLHDILKDFSKILCKCTHFIRRSVFNIKWDIRITQIH